MSLLTTASPYHSREDGSGGKVGKKSSNRRKATMPSLSSTSQEVKNYMSQLIKNKEPQPSLYSYNGTPIDELYSYQPSNISDMLYPTLEDTSSKNLPHSQTSSDDTSEPKKGEELLQKMGALPPEEMPSFYKKNKTQQSGITSALQKLTGSKTITQEGMTNYGETEESILASSSSSSSVKENSNASMIYDSPYIPTMPAFTLNQNNNETEKTSPVDYLKSSPSSQAMYSDYLSSYSNSNYVVPPNLSQYSYPIMRPSTNAIEQMYSMNDVDTNDRTQQILLEKINYMIYLLEQQKKEKSKHTTEEFVLYSFLGVFVIYIADSFARSGRYIR